jgi:ATP-dependent DNA helicase RecG
LGLQRIDVPKFPQPVYREAILNAVAHRNYGLPGNVIVRHFPDRLEVMSPGGFPAGVHPDNILRQVVPRNRLLADVLGRVGYVERAGYGHLELDLAAAMGLLQRNEGETSEVLAGLVRNGLLERMGAGRSALYQLTVETAEQLGVSALGRLLTPVEQEARVLAYARERGQITNPECQRVCGISPDQAFKLLARLAKAGKLKARGGKRGRYYIPPDG